jgi:hypothetical protein
MPLGKNKVRRGFMPVTVTLQIKSKRFIILQMADSGAFQRCRVDKHVLVTLYWCYESKGFGKNKPFHGAVGHLDISCIYATRLNAMAWPSVVRVATEAERRQKIEI